MYFTEHKDIRLQDGAMEVDYNLFPKMRQNCWKAKVKGVDQHSIFGDALNLSNVQNRELFPSGRIASL